MHFSEIVQTPTSVPARAATSSTLAAPSAGTNSSTGSSGLPEAAKSRKSMAERALEKTRSKVSRRNKDAARLSDDEEEFEKQKAKEIERYRRKAEYEQLALREKTVFGMKGAGGWTSG